MLYISLTGQIGFMPKEGRRDILEVTEQILKILSDKQEHSVKNISDLIGAQWRTTIKSLEFLKRIGLVKERKGEKTYREERLFRLK